MMLSYPKDGTHGRAVMKIALIVEGKTDLPAANRPLPAARCPGGFVMPVDFKDAAERHWSDAGTLFQQSRLANADHLFGLAAECALKAVMQALGMGLDATSGAPADKAHKVHINHLWTEFITFATGRSGAQYVSLLPAGTNPFTDWDVSQRYEHQSQFAQNVVQQHQQGAKNAMAVLQQAKQDGRV